MLSIDFPHGRLQPIPNTTYEYEAPPCLRGRRRDWRCCLVRPNSDSAANGGAGSTATATVTEFHGYCHSVRGVSIHVPRFAAQRRRIPARGRDEHWQSDARGVG